MTGACVTIYTRVVYGGGAITLLYVLRWLEKNGQSSLYACVSAFNPLNGVDLAQNDHLLVSTVLTLPITVQRTKIVRFWGV